MRWLPILQALVTGTLVSATLPARAATRDEVAKRWAPIVLQETNDPIKDLLTAFDFDGNWNGDDNAENMACWASASACDGKDNPKSTCAGKKCPLIATVYFTVIETKTHWFVQYMPYHPLDWKLTNGHEHDTESILAVVAKEGGGTGKLLAMETRFHLYWFDYADATVKNGAGGVDGPIHYDSASGRPQVYSQMVGHGLCGGFSPPNRLFPDLSITCNHGDTPHIDQTGVSYSPDLPATMPTIETGKTVKAGYALVELRTSIWPHIKEIGPGKAFSAAIDFKGERCATLPACPIAFGGAWEGNEGSSPGEPWAQVGGTGVSADGDQFFDPAYTLSKRLTFPAPFSLDYCYNPYVGIDDSCGGTPDDAGADTGDATLDVGGETESDAFVDDASDSGVPFDAGPADTSAGSNGGCGCRTSSTRGAAPFSLLALVILAWSRRRARG
jgi:MYXO-CTERM domain-containing protein